MPNTPIISTAQLNGGINQLTSTPYTPGADGMNRFPHQKTYVNYIYVHGMYFGSNPTVKLTLQGVDSFHAIKQENDVNGQWIKYWFWCVAPNEPAGPIPRDFYAMNSTLSVVVETLDPEEPEVPLVSQPFDANNGVPIFIATPVG